MVSRDKRTNCKENNLLMHEGRIDGLEFTVAMDHFSGKSIIDLDALFECKLEKLQDQQNSTNIDIENHNNNTTNILIKNDMEDLEPDFTKFINKNAVRPSVFAD